MTTSDSTPRRTIRHKTERKTFRLDRDIAEQVAAISTAERISENSVINQLCRAALADTQVQITAPAPTLIRDREADITMPLADIEAHLHATYLAAEAALQAIAYQRDHPNMPSDELLRVARNGAQNRVAHIKAGVLDEPA